MVKEKKIYIRDIHVGYATTVNVSPETSTEQTPTFDGVITDGTDIIPWTVSIDKIRYGKISEYIELEKLLHGMFTKPENIKVVEESNTVDGSLRVTDIIYNCILETKDYEINTDSRTVENLSFKGTDLNKWVNGEQIT